VLIRLAIVCRKAESANGAVTCGERKNG